MKHFKLLFIFLVSVFLFSNTVWAIEEEKDESSVNDYKVKVYMMTKEGCPGCEVAYEYFDGLLNENPDLFEFIPFEVFDKEWQWNSNELQTLFIKTYEYFNENINKASTPTIIIGDYHSLGLPNEKNIVYDAIVANQKNGKDVISVIAKENNLNIDELKYDRNKQTSSNYDALIVIGIFVVLIGGFAGLIIIGKK